MIKCMLLAQNVTTQIGGEEIIEQWQTNDETTLWIDISEMPHAEEEALLKRFNCHPLAISDAMRDRHPPKIELFDDYIFILYRGILSCDRQLNFKHLQISMFIGKRVIITRHVKPSRAIDSLFNAEGEKFIKRSTAHLALRIFHTSCGLYLQELFKFESELEKLEDLFHKGANDAMMRQLTRYQSSLVKLRRAFNYHVNIGKTLVTFLEDEYTDIITEKEIHTVNDLNERVDRLLSLSQMYYDICGDLINGYLSITSHQLNATMRVLTVITAIFVPLTFLAGIYGMNFENIPELKNPNGYFILMGVMAVMAVGLIALFKKKKWL